MSKQTLEEFTDEYDPTLRRVARDAWEAMNPHGIHTNGLTYVRVEISHLLRLMSKWKRQAPGCTCNHDTATYGHAQKCPSQRRGV